MKRLKFTSLIAAVALLAGCSTTAAEPVPSAQSLDAYYGQKLSWQDCATDLKCAVISVPLDYSNLSKGSIRIAVNRSWTGSGEPQGELLVNPGGPGASGYDFVKNSVQQLATETLRQHYAIIGFDPRGVQHGSAIHCLDSKQLDVFFYLDDGIPIGSAADVAATKEKIANFIAGCQKNSGDLLGNVDTESAARDMDIIRSLLKQAKLDYLGFSYGTFLGTVYANLFPDKVGRMVLDGAVDPTASASDSSVHQLIGFDSALKAYLRNCETESACPFKSSLDANLATIAAFLKSIEGHPLANSDDANRPVSVWAVETGMMMALYSKDYWTYLDKAFAEAFEKSDATIFQRLADAYNERDASGKYSSNINEANIAINCLDSREDGSDAAMQTQNERMLAASPTLGRYWQFGALLCANWPYPVKRTIKDFSADGTPTIMVLGTTNDPATPYEQAVNLAHKVLKNGYLVTFQGEGHTAYPDANGCIANAVDNYLISGELKAQEPKC